MKASWLPPPLALSSVPLIKARHWSRLWYLLPALLSTVFGAKAESGDEVSSRAACSAEQEINFRGGTLRVENDMFANTDQNYTSGVAITAVSHDIAGQLQTECLPLPVRLHAQLIKFMNPQFWAGADDPAHSQNVVVRFGQSMYTPEDYSRSDVITDDRPYAGLLYVGLAWNRRRPIASDSEILDTREITLGVIGPWSFAEQSQNEVHDAVGSKRFHGWDNQLNSEAALQLAFDRKYKAFRGTGVIIPGFATDAIKTVGLRLGNIESSATLGIEGRLGWNLPNDFGSYPIRPGAENRAPSPVTHYGGSIASLAAERRPRAGVHLFGTLEGKIVAYDFSLDGNLLGDSHTVTRRPWVGQAGGGISIHGIMGSRGYRLALMRVYRTREFEEQRTNHAYGSIALSVEF